MGFRVKVKELSHCVKSPGFLVIMFVMGHKCIKLVIYGCIFMMTGMGKVESLSS